MRWRDRRRLKKQLDLLSPTMRAWAERALATAEHYRRVLDTMPRNDLRTRAEDGLDVIDTLAAALVAACAKADALHNAYDPERIAALTRQIRDAEWGARNAPDPNVRAARRELLDALQDEAEVLNDVQTTYQRTIAELQADYARLTALGAELDRLGAHLTDLDSATRGDAADRALNRLQAASDAAAEARNRLDAGTDIDTSLTGVADDGTDLRATGRTGRKRIPNRPEPG